MKIEVVPPPADGCAPVGGPGRAPAPLNSGEVYRQHVEAVRRALSRLGVREPELDDATHDVFMVLLRRIHDYDGEHAARHWLMGIARRVASTYRRSSRRRNSFLDRFSVHPTTPPRDRPEAHLERVEVSGVVEEFLDELDPDKCAVFVLSEIRGLSGPEISEALGVNLNTVYWRLRTARQAFDRMVERRRQPQRQSLAGLFLWPFQGLRSVGHAALHTGITATPLVISLTTIGAHVDAAPRDPVARELPQEVMSTETSPVSPWIPALLPEDDGIIVFPTAEPLEPEPRPRARRARRDDAFGGRGRYVPRMDRKSAEEKAAVSRNGVFYTVRAHINEIRGCYNQVLVGDRNAEGRVVVAFTIDEEGSVARASIESSDIEDALFASCVVETVRAWTFPVAPDGNQVLVRYPFVLSADDEDPGRPR